MGVRGMDRMQVIADKANRETFLTVRGEVIGTDGNYDIKTIDGQRLSSILEQYAGAQVTIAVLGCEKR